MTPTELKTLNTELVRLHAFEDGLLRELVAAGFNRESMYAAWACGRRAGHLLDASQAREQDAPEHARVLGRVAAQYWILCNALVRGSIVVDRYMGPTTDDGRLRPEHYALRIPAETVQAFERLFGEHSLVRLPGAWEAQS